MFEVTASGMKLESVDTAHCGLVSLMMNSDGFEHYRVDRQLVLGVDLKQLAKVLKCANNDDSITLSVCSVVCCCVINTG